MLLSINMVPIYLTAIDAGFRQHVRRQLERSRYISAQPIREARGISVRQLRRRASSHRLIRSNDLLSWGGITLAQDAARVIGTYREIQGV